jgi:hypothetical protein
MAAGPDPAVTLHDIWPDQVVGPQRREDLGQLAALKHAALADRRLPLGHTLLVNQQADLSGVAEVQQSGQQGHTRGLLLTAGLQDRQRTGH